jgi:hypothetical protein
MEHIVGQGHTIGLETFQCENAEDEREQERGQEEGHAPAEGGVADLCFGLLFSVDGFHDDFGLMGLMGRMGHEVTSYKTHWSHKTHMTYSSSKALWTVKI